MIEQLPWPVILGCVLLVGLQAYAMYRFDNGTRRRWEAEEELKEIKKVIKQSSYKDAFKDT